MNAARKAFYPDFIMENASDQGRLFRAAKKLLSEKEAPSFPNYLDKTALTNGIFLADSLFVKLRPFVRTLMLLLILVLVL